jgi:hypothetical protein
MGSTPGRQKPSRIAPTIDANFDKTGPPPIWPSLSVHVFRSFPHWTLDHSKVQRPPPSHEYEGGTSTNDCTLTRRSGREWLGFIAELASALLHLCHHGCCTVDRIADI